MANFCYIWLYTPTPAEYTSIVYGKLQRRVLVDGHLTDTVRMHGGFQPTMRLCGVLRGVVRVDGQLSNRLKIVRKGAAYGLQL